MNIAKRAIVLLFVIALIVAAVPAAFGQDTQKAVSNTAVANTETNAEPAEPYCRESDSGKDFWNQGVTKTLEGSKEDYCDGTVLFEYYCDANKIQLTRYQCKVSCREGKCVKDLPLERPTAERVNVRPEVRPVPAPNLPTDEDKDDKDSSEKSLLERILKLERRVAELESLVQKLSSCCERPQPVPVPTPVPAPVDPCTERCGEVKLKCYSTCKVRAKGDDKSQRACEAQCAPEVERCYQKCRPEKERPKEEPRPLPPVQEPKFPCAERCASTTADCKEDCRSQYADLQKEANDKFPRKLELCYQERCEPKMKECLRACEGREGETGTATQVLREEAARRELREPTVAEASEGEEPQGDESEQEAAMKRRRSFFEWLFGR